MSAPEARCPRGHRVTHATPGKQNYPAHMKCYECDPYGRAYSGPEADRLAGYWSGVSGANAERYNEAKEQKP